MAGVKRMPASTRLSLRFAERRGMATSAKRYFKVDTNSDYDTGKKPTREKVRVKGLTATQNTIHSGFKAQKNPSKKPISVYRTPGGKNVIMEGHHRSARAAARGDTHVDALVYRRRFKKSALEALDEAIEKAGLIKPSKPSLLRRVGFLLSTGRDERKFKIGRYLEGRKAGKGFGPRGKRRARTGTYTGVYATGVNKSEHVMDAIEALDEVIEKAKGKGLIRGGSSAAAKRIRIVGDGRNGRVKQYLGTRKKFGPVAAGSKGKRFEGYYEARRGVYKSADEPSALDLLDEAIEKALRINGGVKVSPAQRRRIALDRGRFAKPVRGGTQAPKRFAGVGENGRSGVTRRALARVKANPSGENKRHLKTVRSNNAWDLDRNAKRRGVPSNYKRTILGDLKRK